jgi:hypothetical protein
VSPPRHNYSLKPNEKPLFAHGEGLHLVGRRRGSSARILAIGENAKDTRAITMTSRFPTPWRIVEIPTGFAVEDATGRQLGVFYGRADPNTAGHTGFLTIEEAREIALDFARLPELLKQTSARCEVAKATPQHEPPTRTRAQAQNARHTPRQLARPRANLVLHSKID